MATPNVQPRSICLKPASGGSAQATVGIDRVPSATTVTATLEGASSSLTFSHLSVFARIRRPATEEEIAELPPFPPSIRERARREGIEELVETDRVGAGTPVAVGLRGSIYCTVTATAPTAPATGMLVIQGAAWPRVAVPIAVLPDAGSAVVSIVPEQLRRAAGPGEVISAYAVVLEAPTHSAVVAHVPDGGGHMWLESIVARRPVRREYTPEELEELPPWPPSIRQDAEKYGYIEYQETGRTGECVPLAVERGHQVVCNVTFSAPEQQQDVVTGQLVVEGSRWQQVKVPLELRLGEIEAVLSPTSLAVRQGGSADLTVELTSVAGGDTDVRLELGAGPIQWWLEPSTVHVPRGAQVTATLRVHVDPRAPVGTFPIGVDTTSFDGLHLRRWPFELQVLPAAVDVRLLRADLHAAPGGRATGEVEVVSQGGYKVITLTPGAVPFGASMRPVTVELPYGASRMVVPIEIDIDPRASLVDDATVMLSWSAGDGVNSGVLSGTLDIAWPPDSRTFRQQITTPAGTALGGWAELTIRSDGTWTFSGHMHGSGFDPYAFRVNVVLSGPSAGVSLAAMKSGSVGGTIGSTPRDFDWREDSPAPNLLLKSMWGELRNGTAAFSKWYENTGVLGTLEDIATAVAEFLAAAVVVGPFVAAVIVVGSELGALAGLPFHHPTVVAGVFVAGATLLILGPVGVLAATVAGVVAASQVKARRMRDSEIAEATKVFGDTLPIDRILICNFDRFGRKFCIPNVDGSILIGLGDWYDNPLADPARASVFMHELTHAWQIKRTPVLAEMFFEAMVNEVRGQAATYPKPPIYDGRAWHDYEIEYQGEIVEDWYLTAAMLRPAAHPGENPFNHSLDTPGAMNHGAFRYISNNLRLGQP